REDKCWLSICGVIRCPTISFRKPVGYSVGTRSPSMTARFRWRPLSALGSWWISPAARGWPAREPAPLFPPSASRSAPERYNLLGRTMSKEDSIEVTGTVVEKFPSGLFSVELDQDRKVLAHLAGKLRRHRIRVLAGDRVTLEMSPYDLTKAR